MSIFRYYADFYQMRVHCTLTYFMDWVTRIPRPDGANEAYSEISIVAISSVLFIWACIVRKCGQAGVRVCELQCYCLWCCTQEMKIFPILFDGYAGLSPHVCVG